MLRSVEIWIEISGTLEQDRPAHDPVVSVLVAEA